MAGCGGCGGKRAGYEWEVTLPDGTKKRVAQNSEAVALTKQGGPGSSYKAVSKAGS